MPKKIFSVIICIFFVISLAGITSPKNIEAAEVKLNKKKIILKVGEKYNLKLKNSNGTIKWKSSNNDVVKVKNGKLTAKTEGKATITAKYKGKKYKCTVTINGYNQKGLQNMVKRAKEFFYHDVKIKEELESEIQIKNEIVPSYYMDDEMAFYVLNHDGKSMRFFMEIIGKPDENGRYPLYIALHGGGGGGEEAAEINNTYWIDMFDYYKPDIENGIYVCCRGITDTWDLHFQEDSYILYDRLIEELILNYNADPNKVYLLGFSAGGDGVYQISPRLADRFAAVNMSSGHPNGVLLLNLANCPIVLQAGIRDYYSESAMRSVRAAEFEKILFDYSKKYGFGYEHKVFIHVPEGHNFIDNEDIDTSVLKNPEIFAKRAVEENLLDAFLEVLQKSNNDESAEEDESEDREAFVTNLSYAYYDDEIKNKEMYKFVTEILGLETVESNTSAVKNVSQFIRNPAPLKIVWDLSTRARNREKVSFYWLKADQSVNKGIITAEYDPTANTIKVEPDADVNGDFAILFHPALIDVNRPVTIKTGDISYSVKVNPTEAYFINSMIENGDPELACIDQILYSTVINQR